MNAFVERYHRRYGEEGLAIHRLQDQAQADEVTQRYRQHFNGERPNQAITCHNHPPRLAFPTLPQLPALPQWVDPDSWLAAIDGRRYRRRVTRRGSIRLDNRTYYIKQALAGQYVTVRVDAAQRQLVIEHDKRPIQQIPIKGLYRETLSFETYFEAIREEARLDWRRMMQQRQRRVTMISNRGGVEDVKQYTRRDEIFEWASRYADEMDGPTPSINEIALHFKLNYTIVYNHVMKLIIEGRLGRSGVSLWSWEATGSSRRD